MAITITLNAAADDPFNPGGFKIDFVKDNVPAIPTGLLEPTTSLSEYSDPVSEPGPFTRTQDISFGTEVVYSSVAGRTYGSLITDGATILASDENDVLKMTDFSERVSGDFGNDQIFGRGGDDFLVGGVGYDSLYGGPGSDTLRGGPDIDAFVFLSQPSETDVDHVLDFHGDLIALSEAIFKKLEPADWKPGASPIVEEQFYAGSKAHDSDDRILYNRKTGELFYDLDGSRHKHEPILFAILDNHAKLHADDFLVG